MDIKKVKETNETQNTEKMKIRDLKSPENKTGDVKKPLTVKETDKQVENKIFGEGVIEDKLNKNNEISFKGYASICEKYCAKKRDSTSVHGGSYVN